MILRSAKLLLSLTFLFFNHFAWSHGEDKPGPSGGYIRMPGAFHVELVPDAAQSKFKVFLLDMEWKNPVVKDSTVVAEYQSSKGVKVSLDCQAASNHFECQLASAKNSADGKKEESKSTVDWSWKKGVIYITAKRENMQGNVAEYKLPLKFEKPKASGHGHGHGH